MTRKVTLSSDTSPLPVRIFGPPGEPRGAVIFYMDAFGLRPELDGLCRRWTSLGYTCFLPDLYHRLGTVRFSPPRTGSEPLPAGMDGANSATTIAMTLADTSAILAYAELQPETRDLCFGTVGHCMGARHALAALASYPQKIKVTACLHGGRMVSEGPESPHLFIPKIEGVAYIAFAADDPTCPDAHKATIEETIATSGVQATTRHFDAAHGWTFPERWCYDHIASEAVWIDMEALFERELTGGCRPPHPSPSNCPGRRGAAARNGGTTRWPR